MAAGSLNSVAEKNKENMVRDRETNQGGSNLLWDVLSTNWTFCGRNPLSIFFFFFWYLKSKNLNRDCQLLIKALSHLISKETSGSLLHESMNL